MIMRRGNLRKISIGIATIPTSKPMNTTSVDSLLDQDEVNEFRNEDDENGGPDGKNFDSLEGRDRTWEAN